MAKTMYPVVAGVIPTTITSAFKASSSTEINLNSVEYIPDAPNHITIRDDSNSFVTVKYTTKSGNKLSGLSYVEGDSDHSFASGSFAARVYDAYDNNSFIENINENTQSIKTHTESHTNPHQVTKTQIMLGNVDNTSDLDKPISTATQAAITTVTTKITTHENNKSNPHQVNKTQLNLGNVDNTSDLDKPISTATQTAINTVTTNLNTHKNDTGNPHQVTKAQLNLENVDNTSDINKPISSLTQAAINTVTTNINTHKNNKSNPHQVTKTQLGLGNVDNTSDINKPISLLVQSALDAKVDKVTGKGLSTNDYTTSEKNKLAGIAAGAEVNVQSDWNTTSQTDDSYIQNKPSTLPNPKALKFTGATNASYDGNTEVSINLKNYTPTIDSNGVVNFP